MYNISSPRHDDKGVEQLLQAKGLIAPRVTPSDIQNNLKSVHYFTAAQGSIGASDEATFEELKALDLLTFCVIVLQNGFTVTGESACASPENFDAEIGRKLAYDNAINKIWPLMGYELKCRLHKEQI